MSGSRGTVPPDEGGAIVRKSIIRSGAVAVGLIVLAGCGSSGYGGGSASSSSSSAGGGTSNAVLKTASSDLGKIVVDGDGRTVYVFDKDTPGSGKSVCSGDCIAKWPAVTADSDSPEVDGVSGDVGTITRDDGTKQVTLAGMPLYLYGADSQAGDVTGQATGGVWWVVAPDGKKIAAAAASSSAPPSSSGY
jgi:predicted lipoprotein with Yx(FWY)xxD motif